MRIRLELPEWAEHFLLIYMYVAVLVLGPVGLIFNLPLIPLIACPLAIVVMFCIPFGGFIGLPMLLAAITETLMGCAMLVRSFH